MRHTCETFHIPSNSPCTVVDCAMAGVKAKCRRVVNKFGPAVATYFWEFIKNDWPLEPYARDLLKAFFMEMVPRCETDELMATAVDILDNPENTSNHYRIFTVPKKSGGKRTIEAPDKTLKIIQRAILDDWWYQKRPPDRCMHGFVPGRGCLTNAWSHVKDGLYGRNKVLLKTDFSDLFTSITRASVMNALMEDVGWILFRSNSAKSVPRTLVRVIRRVNDFRPPIGVSVSEIEQMARTGVSGVTSKALKLCVNELILDHVMLRLCCLDERLPQGSPCSPILANIFTRRFHEIAISEIRKDVEEFEYTVYADDTCVTLPNSQTALKEADIARKRIYKTAYYYPDLAVNRDKTGLFTPGTSQRVTGITITDKMSIARKERDKVRAELHAAATGKKILTEEDKMRLRGIRAWMRGVDSKGWDSRCEGDFLKAVGK